MVYSSRLLNPFLRLLGNMGRSSGNVHRYSDTQRKTLIVCLEMNVYAVLMDI